MDFIQPDVREHLMQENHEFGCLLAEHRAADERLVCLRGRPLLSSRESMEEVELKKTKLRAKEKIYKMVQDFNKTKGKQV